MMEGLLLGLIFIGVLTTLLTRYSGIGAVTTILGVISYFWISDFSNWLPIIFLFAGFFLIVLEVFIPDFGIIGILGMLSIVGGLFLNTGSWTEAILDLSTAIIVTGVVFFFIFRKGLLHNRWDQFILRTDSPRSTEENETKKDPYYVGQIGTTSTPLRPTGYAYFSGIDGEEYTIDVTSENKAIERNEKVIIEAINGNKITVRRVK